MPRCLRLKSFIDNDTKFLLIKGLVDVPRDNHCSSFVHEHLKTFWFDSVANSRNIIMFTGNLNLYDSISNGNLCSIQSREFRFVQRRTSLLPRAIAVINYKITWHRMVIESLFIRYIKRFFK